MRPAVGSAGPTAGVSGVGKLCCSRLSVPLARRPGLCRIRTAGWAAASLTVAHSEVHSSAARRRSCGLASTSGRCSRLGRSRRGQSWQSAAAAADQPPEDSDTMQAAREEPDSNDAESEEDLTPDDFDIDIESLNFEYVEYCRERFEIENLVEIGLGANDLPAVFLHHPNGAELEVYLHGANITSWRKKDGTEVLFVRPDNTFDGVDPIQGGIPVVFPQYGRGSLPTNGLLRRMHWSIAATGVADPDVATDLAPSVALFAESDETTLAVWPHKFEAMYTISLMESDDPPDFSIPNPVPEAVLSEAEARQAAYNNGEKTGDVEAEKVDTDPLQLRCVLEIANTDEREFTFTTALQTHFAVRPLGDYPDNSRFVKLLGLGGKYILDYARDPSRPRLDQQEDDYVHFGDRPMDSIFVDTENTDVKLCPGDRTHHEIHMRRGFRDTGAVNPHTRMPDAYRYYVAVPSARVARPVTLKPGETWTGEMVIRSFDTMWERPLFDFDNNVSQPSEAPPPAGDILPPRPNFSSPGTYG